MALVDQGTMNGASVSPRSIREGTLDEEETTISDSSRTLVASLNIEDDEAYRVGQGDEGTQEYARGRLHVTIDDGSGNEPADNAVVEVVKLSSQGRVKGQLFEGTYSQLSQGGPTDRANAYPFPERGNVIANPRKIGIRVEQPDGAGSQTYSLADSTVMLDSVRLEK